MITPFAPIIFLDLLMRVFTLLKEGVMDLWKKVKSLIFVTVTFERSYGLRFLLSECKRVISFGYEYEINSFYGKLIEHLGDGLWMHKGVVFLSKIKKVEGSVEMTFIRGTIDYEKLAHAVMNSCRLRSLGDTIRVLVPPPPHQVGPISVFDSLSLDQQILNLIQEVSRWRASRAWFEERAIPWRMGWLLHGPGGTGKTSLAVAMSKYLGWEIYSPPLNLGDKEVRESWDKMITHRISPIIVLIEDLDCVFNLRKNISSEVSFSLLLNLLGGMDSRDGVFLIITTNHLEKIDPAIGIPNEHGRSTRPGRIDRIIYMGPLSTESRRKMAKRILRDDVELIEKMVEEGEGDTGAQFQDRCCAVALERFWDRGRKT